MTTVTLVPRSLRIVAIVFLVTGGIAVLRMLTALIGGGLLLDTNLVGLWIGPALLRREPWARGWGLFLSWITMLVAIVTFFLVARGPLRIDATYFGVGPVSIHRSWLLAYTVLAVLLASWQITVLSRDPIRRLFATPVH